MVVSETEGSLPIYSGLLTFTVVPPASVYLEADAGVAGVRSGTGRGSVIRIGYDLFDEARFLFSAGQPIDNAHVPVLDLHIAMLRRWIVSAGVPLLEIPPAPAGHPFAVSLTHDIDFVGIRRHRLDHTMWGFLYRSTIGALSKAIGGRVTFRQLISMWRAACSLPFVYAGWVADFWEPFGWYLKAEKGLPATYYLIPFKKRAGDHVVARGGARRATAYDVTDIQEWAARLTDEGCEIGVHGIDAWHDVEKGRAELARVSAVMGTDATRTGIRMHWLLRNTETVSILESAGYVYDSTTGYNETVGYHAGTSQVFRAPGARTLLELPMHIQDGALFYPQRLGLSDAEAEKRCGDLIRHADRRGGVLTVLWHDRSHGPERFWGEFYLRLIQTLKSTGAWFGTAGQIVTWFRQRRAVRFEHRALVEGGAESAATSLRYQGEPIAPPLRVRLYNAPSTPPATFTEFQWDGKATIDVKMPCTELAVVPAL